MDSPSTLPVSHLEDIEIELELAVILKRYLVKLGKKQEELETLKGDEEFSYAEMSALDKEEDRLDVLTDLAKRLLINVTDTLRMDEDEDEDTDSDE